MFASLLVDQLFAVVELFEDLEADVVDLLGLVELEPLNDLPEAVFFKLPPDRVDARVVFVEVALAPTQQREERAQGTELECGVLVGVQNADEALEEGAELELVEEIQKALFVCVRHEALEKEVGLALHLEEVVVDDVEDLPRLPGAQRELAARRGDAPEKAER